MTTKTTVEKEQKQTTNQQSLKGALAGVLEKHSPSEMPKPVAHQAPQEPAPAPTPGPQSAEEKKPFEIPEVELRKILRGES
jgi:hypothetical protein